MRDSLLKDVKETVGGIYRIFNASHAIGYLFNPNIKKDSIANGMYCDIIDEIDDKQWDYFLSFQNNNHLNVKKAHLYKIYRYKNEIRLANMDIDFNSL